MVTAVLPAVTASRDGPCDSAVIANSQGSPGNESCEARSTHRRQESTVTSLSSERTITEQSFQSPPGSKLTDDVRPKGSPSRLAGFVGTLTGCGALLALFVFLPLPARFEKSGISPAEAIKRSFYVVALIALVIAVVCFLGLRHLEDDREKGIKALIQSFSTTAKEDEFTVSSDNSTCRPRLDPRSSSSVVRSYLTQLAFAFAAGFKNANIGLGYIGGFVARASSVGISLFIPLYINHYYRTSGLCEGVDPNNDAGQPLELDLGDIKTSCPKAYVAASILTGVSQLIALLCAPAFGFLSERTKLCDYPLLGAASCGIVGYTLLALIPRPDIGGDHGNAAIFLNMALIGISQIGAIVCSLAVLGNGILAVEKRLGADDLPCGDDRGECHDNHVGDEYSALLPQDRAGGPKDLSHLKGSIAGMYSLFGGAGILLLTKLGGVLFDRLSPRSPFYILAIFNGLLVATGLIHGLRQHWKARVNAGRRVE